MLIRYGFSALLGVTLACGHVLAAPSSESVTVQAASLKNSTLIIIVAQDGATHKRLDAMVTKYRRDFKLSQIKILDDELPPDEVKRLGINQNSMPCYAVIKLSSQGNPEGILGNVIERNVEGMFGARMVMSKILNQFSEEAAVRATGNSVQEVRDLRALSLPNSVNCYCIGKNEAETQSLVEAMEAAKAEVELPNGLLIVAASAEDLGPRIVSRLGFGPEALPCLAMVRNSPDGNPVSVDGQGIIRNVTSYGEAAQGMLTYVKTGSMPATITKKLGPLTAGDCIVKGSNQAGSASPGEKVEYSLVLFNVRGGPNMKASLQVTCKVTGGGPSLEHATRDLVTVNPVVESSNQSTVVGKILIPSDAPAGNFLLTFDVVDTFSLQSIHVNSPLSISGAPPVDSSGRKSPELLTDGTSLETGGQLKSLDGRFSLSMQEDGNLVLRDQANHVLWTTSTNGNGVSLHLGGDGSLKLLTSTRDVLWTTPAAGSGPFVLVLQDDGNLVLYRKQPGGQVQAVWASHTDTK